MCHITLLVQRFYMKKAFYVCVYIINVYLYTCVWYSCYILFYKYKIISTY